MKKQKLEPNIADNFIQKYRAVMTSHPQFVSAHIETNEGYSVVLSTTISVASQLKDEFDLSDEQAEQVDAIVAEVASRLKAATQQVTKQAAIGIVAGSCAATCTGAGVGAVGGREL